LKQHQPNIITTTDEERPSFYSAIMECHYYRNPQQKKHQKSTKKYIKNPKKIEATTPQQKNNWDPNFSIWLFVTYFSSKCCQKFL